MATRWAAKDLAEISSLLDTCKSRGDMLEKAQRVRPGLSLDALERHARRVLGINSLVNHFASRVPRAPAPPAPEVDIPVDVDLSQVSSIEDERKVRRLQQENANLLSAKKRLLDQLGERDAQIEALTRLGASQPPPIVAPRGRGEGKRRLATPVLMLSDWHVEEPVDPAKVNGLNEYNLDIAEKCIDKCADAFEWLVRDSRFDMREAVVWLGGDLYSGYIHAELQESNFLSPVEACVWLQERVGRMLRRILAETQFERILVPCNDGNHGRLTMKMRVSTRTENSLEWLLYKTLAKQFENEPRLVFQIAGGEWNFLDVFDHTIGFFHGDSVRYQGGVGGLLIPMRKALNEMRKYRKVDSFAAGHFHSYLPLPEVTVNGSMIGLGPYSMSIKAAPEPRQQAFYLIDSVKGKCMSAPVWL